jgi:lipopolysaccharide transport system ATP-binding protein
LEPEILICDEVLAVGDVEFQKKCLGKMDGIARAGRTIIFVSHNLAAIARLCNRTLWVELGKIKMDSSTREVVKAYQSEGFVHRAQWIRPDSAAANGSFKFTEISLRSSQGVCSSLYGSNEPIMVEVRYVVSRPLSGCQVGTRVLNSEGIVVFTTSDADHLRVSAAPKESGSYQATFQIPAELLAPGSYSILMAAHLPQRDTYDVVDQAIAFEITEPDSLASLDGRLGVVTPFIRWETVRTRTPCPELV